jgi:hypothetical protein
MNYVIYLYAHYLNLFGCSIMFFNTYEPFELKIGKEISQNGHARLNMYGRWGYPPTQTDKGARTINLYPWPDPNEEKQTHLVSKINRVARDALRMLRLLERWAQKYHLIDLPIVARSVEHIPQTMPRWILTSRQATQNCYLFYNCVYFCVVNLQTIAVDIFL